MPMAPKRRSIVSPLGSHPVPLLPCTHSRLPLRVWLSADEEYQEIKCYFKVNLRKTTREKTLHRSGQSQASEKCKRSGGSLMT
jgi:hypothetical protein